MHLKPTAECQISTLIFGFGEETLYISHEKFLLQIQISKLIFDTQLWA
jgi:hypothetical protein